MKDRDEIRKELMSNIKKDYEKLKKLGFALSDCASVITLFDDRMFKGRNFSDLTEDEQQQTMVDHL